MEINVFGRIGEEISADWISSFLNYAEEDITVKINSYGGDVSEAHAIFNLLRDYKGKVTIEIIGICASAATIIAMAGDIIKIKSNALFMIHETSIFLSDIVKTSDLSKIIESLSKMNETLIDVYSMRTKISKDEIRSMLNKETWMTAEEARIKGFIDEVIPIKDNKELKAQYIAEERARVAELQHFKSKNASSRAIINVAIEQGQTLKDIQPFLDAITEEHTESERSRDEFQKNMQEYFDSGANGIGASPVKLEEDRKKAARDEVISMQRKMRGE